jgi:hypothetical protein
MNSIIEESKNLLSKVTTLDEAVDYLEAQFPDASVLIQESIHGFRFIDGHRIRKTSFFVSFTRKAKIVALCEKGTLQEALVEIEAKMLASKGLAAEQKTNPNLGRR